MDRVILGMYCFSRDNELNRFTCYSYVEDREVDIEPIAPVIALFERVLKLEHQSKRMRHDLIQCLNLERFSK